MGSLIDASIILSDSEELSSFEIEESVIGDSDTPNNSSKSTSHENASEIANTLVQHVDASINAKNYRSPPKESSRNSSSESEEIVLSSDDEEDSHSKSDTINKESVININSKSIASSDDQEPKCTEVTKAEYNKRVAEILDMSDRINHFESLLKLSSQLPDKGQKLKKLVVKLKSDLNKMQETLKYLKIKQSNDLALDFQNLSINETDRETSAASANEFSMEMSYDERDTVSKLIQKIKYSEKSMPNSNDLADQPHLINGKLMPHQKHALAWMIWRENQFPSGGILGDDMGLGKTLTMISLIARHIEMRDSEEKLNAEQKHDDADWNGRTLVICPASVIRQWEDEIIKFTNFGVSVCLHHGDKRSVSAKELSLDEIVITTYGIVRTEVEKNGVLSQILWERIVLDEAHTIRNYTSKQSLSCCRLKGTRKWALTGTPIQNKHGDVFALVKFLQCTPLDEYRVWKHWTKNGPEPKISYLLKFLLLRRTKEELGKIGEMDSLPEKKLEVINVQLTSDEMAVYETVSSFSKILSEKFIHQRNPNNNNQLSKNAQVREDVQKALDFFAISGSVSTSHILLVILRLRQICIHSNLIDAMLMEEDIRDISAGSNLLDELNELKIRTNVDQKLHRSNPVFDPQRPSSKTKVLDRQEKAVVVSQFTSVLQLFESHLQNYRIKYLLLTGSTKISHRQNIVESFNEDSDEQILLLSLTAGGVGLNLCGANNLFFIDPHWNPQLESQAEDRVYRIGQTKPVTIYRFICEGTIEERIQKLQERKKGVAENILSGYKLNIDDMMALI